MSATLVPEPDPSSPRVPRLVAKAALLLLAASTTFGCASVSPWNQRFVEVVTPNFVLVSSFDEEATRTLASDLETFHAGVLYALGLPPDARLPRRTQVVAFDDRGFGPSFSVRGEPAVLLPAVEAPVLVIRAPGPLSERVGADVRHRYAHRVLRARSRSLPPLWYAEGRAQVAGTIRVSGSVAEIGRLHPEFARATAEWKRGDLADVFDVTRLDDRSRASRRDFEAASWALVHTILFDGPRKQEGLRALERVRSAFGSGRPGALATAVRALGGRSELAERVWAHVGSKKHRVDRVQIADLDSDAIAMRPLSARDARVVLARLALDLGRPGLALEYFDRVPAPRDADVDAGRAIALLRLGRVEDARRGIAERAREAAASELALELELERARVSPDSGERDERLARVLAWLREGDATRPGTARAWLALARLVDGTLSSGTGEPVTAELCLASARAVGTGSLEVELVAAELRRRKGQARAAAFHAREVVSRSHDPTLQERGRVYLEAVD